MASRSLNRVILIGNLTRDPELKYTPSGVAVCTFGVATNRNWTTASGEQKEETQYHRIVAWQKLAELCGKILTKGRKVYLEGRITYRTYTGKDNIQRQIAEIVLDDFIVFNDGKKHAGITQEVEAKEPVKEEVKVEEEVPPPEAEEVVAGESGADQKSEEEKIDESDIPF
ncbi:MAG: single-stranded DNA-binding protein [Microgenomates group bacterium]